MTHAIPPHIRSAYAEAGVDPGSLKHAVYAPLLQEPVSKDIYMAADADTLYLLYGEEITSTDKKTRRLVITFQAERLERYNLAEIGELKTERLVSTARFWTDGRVEPQFIFYIGTFPQVSRFVKAVEAARKDETAEEQPPPGDEFCPTCGLRYPEENRKICPRFC